MMFCISDISTSFFFLGFPKFIDFETQKVREFGAQCRERLSKHSSTDPQPGKIVEN